MPFSDRLAPWAWVPIPVLLLAMSLLSWANWTTTQDLPRLLAVLNFAFGTGISVFIAFLAGRTFLTLGTLSPLFLGAGMLLMGASFLAAPMAGRGNPNVIATIHNVGMMATGTLQFLGTWFATRRQDRVRAPAVTLGVVYLAAMLFVLLVTYAAVYGVTPPFFVPGSGGTTIRDVVLAMAIGLLAASALALVIAQGTVDTFRRWYAFGLLLLGVGLIGIMVQKSLGSPLNWIARAAQYLGAVYLLVASLPYASRVRRWSLPLEAALRQAEAQARDLKEALIARASAPIVVWDAARRITLFNRAFEQMTGYPADEVLGRDLVLLFPEASRVESLARIAATAEGTRWESVEIPIRCKSGEVRLVLWNSASALEATIAQGQDITERKRAEEALRESEARLRAFVDAIPGPVFLKDADSRWLVGNRALFEVVGKSASFAIGKTDREIFDDPAVGDAVMENDRRIMKSGVPEVVEETIPTPAGTRIFHSTKVPHRDASGRVVGIIGSALDITETRTLQGQLAVTSRLAALGTLVAGVAHEINNPLAIEMASQGLALELARESRRQLSEKQPIDREAKLREVEQVIEALEDAQEGGQRIAQIVRDMAIFANPTLKLTRVKVAGIVQGAIRWLPAWAQQFATVQVEDHGAPDVLASSGQIEQVVQNLITNAAKATPKGERVVITVRIGPGSTGMARLEVIDHGVGIAPQFRERIFDPFFTTRPAGEGRGSGLGLSICHAIVTAHGGTITVVTEVGKGSNFRVELPVASGEA